MSLPRKASVERIRPNEYVVECFRRDATGEEICAERRTCGSESQAWRIAQIWVRGDWEQ